MSELIKAFLRIKKSALEDTNFTPYTIDELDYKDRLEKSNAKIEKDSKIVIDKLKVFEIIINIIKPTSHFILKERQNFGEDEMSYYLVIGYGMSECEYKLKGKEEYDLLSEVLCQQ